jgi:hypothetical protein
VLGVTGEARRQGSAPNCIARCLRQYRDACDSYAKAIDDAHRKLEWTLAGAGIAAGVTTAIGVLLTPFTGGASDVGAGAAAAAEIVAIAEPIIEGFETTVATEVDEPSPARQETPILSE